MNHSFEQYAKHYEQELEATEKKLADLVAKLPEQDPAPTGDLADALEGIRKMQEYWNDGHLLGGFNHPVDKKKWNELKESSLHPFEKDAENSKNCLRQPT